MTTDFVLRENLHGSGKTKMQDRIDCYIKTEMEVTAFNQRSMQGLLSYYKPLFLRCGFQENMRKNIYIYIAATS